MLDEVSLVPRFTCEAAEPILEGRQRAHPPSKVDSAPPEHRRYVEPRQSWVNGEGEPAKHREGSKGQMQNEDTLGRKLIEHLALPNGSGFSCEPRRLRGRSEAFQFVARLYHVSIE